MRRTSLLAIVLFAVLLITGCARLDEWIAKNKEAIQKGQQVAAAAGTAGDPATGGLSGLAVSLAIAVFNGVVAINRQIVLNKQKKAAAAVVQSFEVAKAAGAVTFTEPLVQILDIVQDANGKALVDSVQGANK